MDHQTIAQSLFVLKYMTFLTTFAKPSRSIRLGGEQTNHEITGAPLVTVLPSKNGLSLRVIVSMFNKIQLFPKFKKFSGENTNRPIIAT